MWPPPQNSPETNTKDLFCFQAFSAGHKGRTEREESNEDEKVANGCASYEVLVALMPWIWFQALSGIVKGSPEGGLAFSDDEAHGIVPPCPDSTLALLQGSFLSHDSFPA